MYHKLSAARTYMLHRYPFIEEINNVYLYAIRCIQTFWLPGNIHFTSSYCLIGLVYVHMKLHSVKTNNIHGDHTSVISVCVGLFRITL